MGQGSEQRNWQDETRLDRLSYRAGLHPDEVREWLRGEVDRRLRATVPKTPMVKRTCSECGQSYEVSERRARERTRCEVCRFPLAIAPTAEELAWAEAQPEEVRAAAAFMGIDLR